MSTETTTTTDTRICTPYNIGKMCADEGGRFSMSHVRAYVGARMEPAKPAPAVLVATNGKALVVAHARAFGDPTELPYATTIPAPALACAIKSRDKVRDLNVSTEPNRVTALQEGQPVHVLTEGTDCAYVPWRNVCSGIVKNGKTLASVTLSADLLRDLLASMDDRSGGKNARPQTVRLTFQPDRNGNADRAILVTSDTNGSGEPCAALIMPCTKDDSAESHAARVVRVFDDAIAVAARTGAPEMQ